MESFIAKSGIFGYRTLISRILLTALINSDKKRKAIKEMVEKMRKPS